MAVAIRGGKEAIAGVVFHTDQGSEYTARSFRLACDRLGIRQSMGRVGSALDNAVIESWHSTLEFELRGLERFATKAAARVRVAAWIDEYNRDRKHSSCGMRSPLDYESRPAHRRPLAHRAGRCMSTAPDAKIMAPSSPASRPSPSGDLRPALTPAAGGTAQHPSGADKKEDQQIKIRLTEVSTVRGDCQLDNLLLISAGATWGLRPEPDVGRTAQICGLHRPRAAKESHAARSPWPTTVRHTVLAV
jgi:hypothetical protein